MMPARPTWLEVSLNGPWTRQVQPGIPISRAEIVAQGIACVRAGAAIVHVHAYDEATGRQRDDATLYAAIIEGIRDEVDAIVYPTIPLTSPADAARNGPRARFAAIEELARRGLLEWAVVDPGSVNLARYDAIAGDREGFVYANSEADIRAGLALAERHRFHPGYACYEPGFVRLGAALHRRHSKAPQPIYRLMFSDAFAFGFPPLPYALDAYRTLLAQEAPEAPWMVAGLGVDILPLVPAAVAAGGHVRVGLEDAPFGTRLRNIDWVEQAVAAITAAGGTLATSAEVRASFAGSS
jgi:uncharacterized protein (DUF849 family)